LTVEKENMRRLKEKRVEKKKLWYSPLIQEVSKGKIKQKNRHKEEGQLCVNKENLAV